MAEEQTNLVEETTQETPQETQTETPVESTEEKKFDPLAFATDQMMEQYQGKYNEEAADKAEASTESVEQTKETDGFSWDNIEVEKPQEEVQEVDQDWDDPVEAQSDTKNESVEETGEIDWAKVSKELGISANGKDEIIKALNSQRKSRKK